MVTIVLALVFLGCDGSSEAGQPGCASREAGLERDTCFGDLLLALPASEAEQVKAIGSEIQDGMVRQAAISRWVADHANEIPKETGEGLCKMLGGRDQSYCLKRFLAVHLQR
ncbi:MAG: hypothetical protein ACI8S6_002067 [Myxococcota bacterium]|jgi:hypothetical protein